MTHLFGIPMDEKKVLGAALCSIPGIGKNTVTRLSKELGLNLRSSWGKLTLEQKESVYAWLKEVIGAQEGGALGTEYKRERALRKSFLISLGSHRGIRLRQGLPVRGQNTHTNARTARKVSSQR